MVCMQWDNYLSKMNNLLNDNKIYKIIGNETNIISSLQNHVYKIFIHLNNIVFFGENFNTKDFTQTDSTLSKCYGLPKIHKIKISVWPIISTINSTTESLSKIILHDFKKAIKIPKSHINNSFELKQKLKN